MSYQDFQQRVYSYLIKYKKENLKIIDKGTSAHGVEHDCLLPKPYSEAKIPIMLYDGIKETVKDIQACSIGSIIRIIRRTASRIILRSPFPI